MSVKLAEIAQLLGCEVLAEYENVNIHNIRGVEYAGCNDITFVNDEKLLATVSESNAVAYIIPCGTELASKITLEVDDPYLAYAKVAILFEDKSPAWGDGVHSSAIIDFLASLSESSHVGPGTVIGADVTVGNNTVIGANCVIENGVKIGDNCRIDSTTVLRRNSILGNRVIVQAATVIGSEGFGNAKDGSCFVRIPCFGNVIINDDVEIGACVTIDRGNFGATKIGRGTRIDNLVHIAHNVVIGEDAAIVAQVGISGSTTIGNRAILAGQAGLVGHINVGDDAFIAAKAGVSKSVKAGARITGYPARDFMTMRRIEAAQTDLPALRKQIRQMQKDINSLKEKIDL